MNSRLQRDAQRGILEDLQSIAHKPIGDIGEFLKIYGENLGLQGGATSLLAEFSSSGVKVGKSGLVLPIQVTETIKDRTFSVQQILSSLDTDNISLNHLGVRYKVPDLNNEMDRIVEYMKNDVYSVFEDRAGREFGMRWLFIGIEDQNNPGKPILDVPMFEIVLVEEISDIKPHMQFDVDTLLTAQSIRTKMQSAMRLSRDKDIFSFHLDIPERVLSMGTYQNTNGIAHDFGIGTDKRSREDHRNTMIKIS